MGGIWNSAGYYIVGSELELNNYLSSYYFTGKTTTCTEKLEPPAPSMQPAYLQHLKVLLGNGGVLDIGFSSCTAPTYCLVSEYFGFKSQVSG